MVTLRAVNPPDIYPQWGWMRNGLMDCAQKTHSRWRPEDVYLQLHTGTAWAYIIDLDGDDVGFVILTREHDPDGPVMFVWIIWCEPDSMKHCWEQVAEELDKLQVASGAKRQRMESPLRGWERVQWGRKVASIYQREE